jgi:hypothetical protein
MNKANKRNEGMELPTEASFNYENWRISDNTIDALMGSGFDSRGRTQDNDLPTALPTPCRDSVKIDSLVFCN